MARLAIIDAEVDATTALSAALTAQGHRVDVFADGNEALMALRQMPPEALVVCVEMPHASGYTLCNKLKRDPALMRIPLLLVSRLASAETFEEHRRLRTRADAYGHKPYEPQAVWEALAPLLESPQSDEEASAPAPAAPPAKKTVRLGEDPSVRDISEAPFFLDVQQGHPRLSGEATPSDAPLSVHERPTLLVDEPAEDVEAAAEPEPTRRAHLADLTASPSEPTQPGADEANGDGDDPASFLDRSVDFAAATQIFEANKLHRHAEALLATGEHRLPAAAAPAAAAPEPSPTPSAPSPQAEPPARPTEPWASQSAPAWPAESDVENGLAALREALLEQRQRLEALQHAHERAWALCEALYTRTRF